MGNPHDEGVGGTHGSRGRGKILDRGLNLAVIAIAVFVVFCPGGAVLGWLEAQVDGRRLRSQLDTLWPEFIAEAHRLDAGSGDVILVQFSDYQCPFCRHTHPELVDFLSEHHGVGVVYRHLPLRIHSAAEGAAKASICAAQHGVHDCPISRVQRGHPYNRGADPAAFVRSAEPGAAIRAIDDNDNTRRPR